jgi:hypothetical protein
MDEARFNALKDKWSKQSTEDKLKEILGDTYGGPSLSYIDGLFVIYNWYDGPVSDEIIAAGKTIEQCLEDYEKNNTGA